MMRWIVLGFVLWASMGCRHSGPRDLQIFAASSLHESFAALAAAFEAAHPGVRVRTSFAGSQELRLQIEHGARADVFASADRKQMEALRSAGLVGPPAIFARNELCIAVSDAAAPLVRSFADLPNAEHIVLGAPEVPVGAYALQLLDRASRTFGTDFRARVEGHVVSRELNTRQVLAKVTLGEADAAIVYRTDVAAAHGRVHVVDVPPNLDVVAVYPLAVVHDAREHDLAEGWVAFVLSTEGQSLLRGSGLLPGTP